MAKYTNIRIILDKLLRHPLLQDITLETAVDYTVDFMRIVGVPSMFEEKTVCLEVKNYRAQLPCDFQDAIQVRMNEVNNKATFRYSNDSFHMSCNKGESIDYTYKIQGDFIYTSIEEGTIELAYKAIPVDDEGYPLLPDNSSFTRALEAYIKKQWFTILFDMSKITQASLQNAQQEYAWAVGDCATEFNRLSIDKMESFTNSWRTLVMRTHAHDEGFKNSGVREVIKIH